MKLFSAIRLHYCNMYHLYSITIIPATRRQNGCPNYLFIPLYSLIILFDSVEGQVDQMKKLFPLWWLFSLKRGVEVEPNKYL